MDVDNIASEVNVQGGNNTISNGNRTVHYNNNFITVHNIDNYHVSPSDSQQPAPSWNPSLPTSLGSDLFEEGEVDPPFPTLQQSEASNPPFPTLQQSEAYVPPFPALQQSEVSDIWQGERWVQQLELEYKRLEYKRLEYKRLEQLELVERYKQLVDKLVTHEDVSWLTDKTVGGCRSCKRTEFYEHLDIDDQEVENILQRLQGKQSLEEEVYTVLDHGLRKKKRTRRYLLDKLYTFDPYLARSYMSFLAQVLLESLLGKLLTFQDVMWLTNKLVGGVCCNSVDSLYNLFDITYQDIDRIRSHHVRKEDSFVDEVFMILDYGLRRQKKKRRCVYENLLLLDEDLAHTFQEYLLSH